MQQVLSRVCVNKLIPHIPRSSQRFSYLQFNRDETGHQNRNDEAHDRVYHIVRVSFAIVVQGHDNGEADADKAKDDRDGIQDHVIQWQSLPFESVQTGPEVVGNIKARRRNKGRFWQVMVLW